MVYLPMAFLSGLWFPLQVMPKFLQQLAPLWPSYHLNALALSAVGLSDASRLPHVLVLAGFTLGFLLLAARRLRRNG
jgi:ABC-2 type transport system permease protein